MTVKSYSTGTAHRRDEVLPYIEVWEQPVLRWLIAKLYHRWEKLTEPLMRPISEWHRVVFGDKSDDYVPLVNRRDIRCHGLKFKGRNMLAIVNITRVQYDVITGKTPKTEEPRHEVRSPVEVEWTQED